MLGPQHSHEFARDGFTVARSLFSPAETAILLDHASSSSRIRDRVTAMSDGDGRQSRLSLWTERVDDVFGSVNRSSRVVEGAQQLLGEDVYHWHSKVMLKEPRTGGAWEWHQDYGYWYNDGCLYPRLISCLIALDRADRANGCLKVLVGSHLLGRIDHGGVGAQAGANRERVAEIEQHLAVRYAELDPGDAIFFHCNLLHSSEPNPSDRPRTSVICCYNAWSNRPAEGKGHGRPVPIELDRGGIERFAT